MLENLIDLVKEHAGNAIINNPDIPTESHDEVVSAASSSIMDGLKNAVSSGNIGDVMSLFNGGGGSNLSQNIQGNFVQSLMGKFGLDANAASGVASNLIPQVLEHFVQKTNDPNDSSFNLQDIISKVGGGNLNIEGLLGQFTGAKTEGGGIMDSLKGLFGS